MVPGLTNSNASLAAENTRLNDRMAKLVKDLTEENTHLLNETQRLNETMQKVSFLLRRVAAIWLQSRVCLPGIM